MPDSARGRPKKHRIGKAAFLNIWNWLRHFPFHPLFLANYAILYFLSANLAQVDAHAADRLLIIFSFITLGFLLATALIFRDLQRAGFLVLCLCLLFFTYPHIKIILQQNFLISASNYVLLPVLCVLLLGLVIVLFKISPQQAASLTFTFNLVTFFLIIIQLSQIYSYERRVTAAQQAAPQPTPNQSANTPGKTGSLPDVYFIVLDGYARADVLMDKFSLDNSEFLAALHARNFYVADCSMSNYSNTEESLASTLNMMYVNDLMSQINDIKYWEAAFLPYIQNNLVRQYLETLGYQTVSFYTGYFWAEWRDATYFLGIGVQDGYKERSL
jgi:hypothetical protein